MKKSEIKHRESQYSKKGQEKIYGDGFEQFLVENQKFTGGSLKSHNRLDIKNNENDFICAFMYACGQLRDSVSLQCILDNIAEDSDECSETYTPEAYLSFINSFPIIKIQKHRKAFKKVNSLVEEASSLMSTYANDSEEEVVKLLHTLFEINSQSLFDKVFKGKTTFDKFFLLIKKFNEEDYNIDIISALIKQFVFCETSVQIDKSLEIVTNILVNLMNNIDN